MSGYGNNVVFAFYAFSQLNDSNTDFFIDNFSITSGSLGLENHELKQFRLYPNPVKQVLTMESSELITEVKIYNLIGHQVLSINPQRNDWQLNLSGLKSGMYILKVKDAHR